MKCSFFQCSAGTSRSEQAINFAESSSEAKEEYSSVIFSGLWPMRKNSVIYTLIKPQITFHCLGLKNHYRLHPIIQHSEIYLSLQRTPDHTAANDTYVHFLQALFQYTKEIMKTDQVFTSCAFNTNSLEYIILKFASLVPYQYLHSYPPFLLFYFNWEVEFASQPADLLHITNVEEYGEKCDFVNPIVCQNCNFYCKK